MVMPNPLFETVPGKDYLSLFHDDKVVPTKVVEFFRFKTKDISRAMEIPTASVRYDYRMPDALRERLSEWGVLINLVAEFFEGDIPKTAQWFIIPNPLLGNLSPRDMIRLGRYKKLLKFIQTAVSENTR